MSGRCVVLLCGPPGAGKSTASRQSGLTVYDRDDVQWTGEAHFRREVAKLADDPDARAVVIRQGATSSARAKAAALIGATHMFVMAAPPDVLAERIVRRGRSDARRTLAAIKTWFDRFDQADGVTEFPGWAQVVGGPSGVSVTRPW